MTLGLLVATAVHAFALFAVRPHRASSRALDDEALVVVDTVAPPPPPAAPAAPLPTARAERTLGHHRWRRPTPLFASTLPSLPEPPRAPVARPAAPAPPPSPPSPAPAGPPLVAPALAQSLRAYDTFPSMSANLVDSHVLVPAATLEICVSAEGAVRDVAITGPSRAFDDRLRAAVLTWRYRPLLVGAVPIPFCHRMRITYTPP